jgi:16S rRNA (guanine(1405)-N(7))-methyltransferase
MPPPELVDSLVEAVLAAPKYRLICRSFVERVARIELEKHASLKDAIKATKNKLHQVGGAYLGAGITYATWLEAIRRALSLGDQSALREQCRAVMRQHASTRERLGVLDGFYREVFTHLPPVHTLLDVACGLNPLAIPWMDLPHDVEYHAVDIYQDMMDFLQAFFRAIRVEGKAEAADVLGYDFRGNYQVALLLKTIPCLEQVDKSSGRRLLDNLSADHLVVSFPARSLGGKDKGMPACYADHLDDLVEGRGWHVQPLYFETEQVFIIDK